MSLDHAPDHIKLAVDLIELLESHDIDPSVAVGALTIALRDFQAKLERIDKEQAKLERIDKEQAKLENTDKKVSGA
ncbi:MAG: YbaM family protein [Gammaproteobacteria bacterium]|jgi:hypothetical protein|uniref:DUF2496 domain-containing protein n=1 Tax=Marinomonas sp. BSi20584 TaxID=1594462 RepID=UPI000C1EFA54|nr:DUF2496 domain-containing protein [Marinomonas sp. BSi20584]MBU1295766.1 YbaM family protein [Gammaproteobacteria bacterium]MBU1468914.1 YbaM family protein [Gammaproteobacteria bacterium]MBU2022219.1 YbaM family protein [Gammaproteobacteria bacterium]MBU2238497.1 YbaM family protein [Gammaproteobacteria bacterium]MBU2321235.1 YbaM family protein [Gammaproteobacteria bacterium]